MHHVAHHKQAHPSCLVAAPHAFSPRPSGANHTKAPSKLGKSGLFKMEDPEAQKYYSNPFFRWGTAIREPRNQPSKVSCKLMLQQAGSLQEY